MCTPVQSVSRRAAAASIALALAGMAEGQVSTSTVGHRSAG
jgi:hypothetical protein